MLLRTVPSEGGDGGRRHEAEIVGIHILAVDGQVTLIILALRLDAEVLGEDRLLDDVVARLREVVHQDGTDILAARNSEHAVLFIEKLGLELERFEPTECLELAVEQGVEVGPELLLGRVLRPEKHVAGGVDSSGNGGREEHDHKSSNERAHRALLFYKTSAKVHLTKVYHISSKNARLQPFFMKKGYTKGYMEYTPKTFTIPSLDGISAKSIEEHLSLYQGYVKNFNTISSKLVEYAADTEKNAHALSELIRRKSFEFDGMRLHEYYFEQFEGGAKELSTDSALAAAFEKEYHGHFTEYFKAIGNMRGPGWAILYYDGVQKQFQSGFVGEQHQGVFATLPIILALDVWEHAFLLDYSALGKAKYIDAFFKNLNWSVIEKRFAEVTK